LCRLASTVEPYEENIYYYWMKSLLEVGEHKDAAKIYEQLKKRLYLDFGMEPNEDMRELYHEAIKTDNGHFISIEDIIHQLKETDEKNGALICEYDFFSCFISCYGALYGTEWNRGSYSIDRCRVGEG